MKHLPRAVRVAAALTLVLAATACGGRQAGGAAEGGHPANGGRLTIATGNTTGVYYQLGGSLAQQISDHVEGYRATATATGASVQNVQGIVAGTYDLGFALLDTANDAVAGTESFSSPQPVEALARLYPNYTQVLVRADSGITSVAEMKGKRISTGSPGSGTEVIARRLLKAAGLDADKDVKAQRLGLPETVDAMKDGTVDALFWSGGLPTAGITDLTTSLKGKVRLLDVTPLLGSLQKTYGEVYQPGTLPAAVYQQPADVPAVIVPNVLLVKKGFDPELARKVTGLLFDRQAELAQANASAKEISPATAGQTGPVPLNPGARTALTEHGATVR
ncbi:TAXI family TRAP transporter solute-binding subunit [Kitasatospora camelliae]|uniref:TAXI family TRAP transporter solute-binding subunit n=1 Tax=Kitasatospora camelliae TaxID=3156397 RepID=A0AAU8K054_9ACTN